MSEGSKVNIAVADRVLLHLFAHYEQLDQYMVTSDLTRNGIAQACAQHPPNVSRAMKDLLLDGLVEEHSRSIINEDRRKKAWQLTPAGHSTAKRRYNDLAKVKVLLRGKDGKLLEIEAGEAADRLSTDIGLLQILLHSQYEGALTYGDIRFGLIKKKNEGKDTPQPGRLVPFLGAHATYHTEAPQTREVHGRESERELIDSWMEEKVLVWWFMESQELENQHSFPTGFQNIKWRIKISLCVGIHAIHGTRNWGLQQAFFTDLAWMKTMIHTI